MDAWVAMHVSDHAGLHHLLLCVRACCGIAPSFALLPVSPAPKMSAVSGDAAVPAPNAAADVLAGALSRARDLCARYPGHEALWMHRRALLELAVHLRESVVLSESDAAAAERLVAAEIADVQRVLGDTPADVLSQSGVLPERRREMELATAALLWLTTYLVRVNLIFEVRMSCSKLCLVRMLSACVWPDLNCRRTWSAAIDMHC